MEASAAAVARDWSELPLDALASVFGKLGAIEILMGAGLVCRSWLQAAKVPELWRSVDMASHKHKVVDHMCSRGPFWLDGICFSSAEGPKMNDGDDVLCAMAKLAVDRSGGQLEEFVGKLFVTDELLKYIADRSPALKSLGLISCLGVSNNGFTDLISKCPRIEDLVLTSCDRVGGRDVYEAIGKACPKLSRFRLQAGYLSSLINPSDGEALGVAAMHELRSLTLDGSIITNDELAVVLDGCPHLEHLDLSGCSNIVVDDEIEAMCAGINSLALPDYKEDGLGLDYFEALQDAGIFDDFYGSD